MLPAHSANQFASASARQAYIGRWGNSAAVSECWKRETRRKERIYEMLGHYSYCCCYCLMLLVVMMFVDVCLNEL